jgi:hypothetical protein
MTARIAAALACAVALLAGAPTARADGDPASDVLYFQDVFLSYPPPARFASRELKSAVAAAGARGYKIKVAVIVSRTDLGLVSVLYGKPGTYARFLGEEINLFYTGPLLVAMPQGFGFYDSGNDTSAAERVLGDVDLNASSRNALVVSAARAVRRLSGSPDTQRTGDTRPPRINALAAHARVGRAAPLRYRVSDSSGRSREVVRVYGPSYALYATLVKPLRRVRAGAQEVRWRIPRAIRASRLRFCVLATDPSGNTSHPSCAPLRIVRR